MIGSLILLLVRKGIITIEEIDQLFAEVEGMVPGEGDADTCACEWQGRDCQGKGCAARIKPGRGQKKRPRVSEALLVF